MRKICQTILEGKYLLRALPAALFLLLSLFLSPAEAKAEDLVSDNYSCGWNPGIASSYIWGQSFVASSSEVSAFSFYYNGNDYGDNVAVNWWFCSDPFTGDTNPYGPFNPCDPSYSGVVVMATGTASVVRLDGWQKITFDAPVNTDINSTYGIAFQPTDIVSVCGEAWSSFASGKIAGTYGGYGGDFSYRIYGALPPSCAEGFISIGDYCVRQDSIIAGYFYPFTPYVCVQNEPCDLNYYYNIDYVPQDTNTMNLYFGYGTSSTFVASSTIIDYEDVGTMTGGSFLRYTFTELGKQTGYLIAQADNQEADGAWIYASPIEVLVSASAANPEATSTIDNLIKKAGSYLKNAFPFNFFFAIKAAWSQASTSTLPADLAFLNPTDTNGDISVNLGAVVPGGPTSTLVLYSDNFIATSSAVAIKGASKWTFHGLLAALIVLIGIKSYKELFGVDTTSEKEE